MCYKSQSLLFICILSAPIALDWPLSEKVLLNDTIETRMLLEKKLVSVGN